MLKAHRLLCAAGLIFSVVSVHGHAVLAQQRPDGRAADEAALRQAGKDYLAAIERGDANAIAAFWTAEGAYTDEHGQTVKARELIQKSFPANSASKPTRPHIKVSGVTVRFLTNDVAIEEGNVEMTPSAGGSAGAGPAQAGRFTALWVRQNGKWKLESLRELRPTDTAQVPAHSAADALAALDRLAGRWSGSSDKMSMQVNASWNSRKTFLHRELSISTDGRPTYGGTQEIGWDAISQSIKSWVFNDDGGYSEALWNVEGSTWVVLSSGVLADGRTSTSTHSYKFIDKDTVLWKLIEGTVDGQPMAKFEMTLKRQTGGR